MADLSPEVIDRLVLRLSVEGEGLGGYIRNQLKRWAAAGMISEQIYTQLQTELTTGGRLYEMIVQQFTGLTSDEIGYISQEQVHEQWTGADDWTWISISDDRRCEDCMALHGKRDTWDNWVARGLPGSGQTRCG